MIRSFALGRLAYLGVAVTISLLVGTVWFTGGVPSDSINIPYCTFQEQRPCPAPPPPAAAVCPTQAPTTALKNSTQPPTSRLHYLLPASKSTDGVCVGITSALLNRYPPPTLLGWKAKGDFDAKGNHIAKLLGISRYLHNVKDAADDDLVIVVDAFDVIAQIPAEATIQLYFDMIGAANERLAARHGMTAEEARPLGLYQSLLWGAEKGCFPPKFHEPQCWLVPESDAAHNQWGPKAIMGEEPWRFPKALNSGAVIGPLGELRNFIDATIVLVDETRDPEAPYANSDQLYIARLYARQEYHRNLDLLPRDKRYPGIDEGKGRTLPMPRVNESEVTEYHVTVDFEYGFAQHHCYNERFMHKLKYNNWDFTTTISNDHMAEGSGFKPFKIQLPGYLARSLARIWESIPQDDKPTSTSREWVQNLRLNTNVATQRVFAFYHSTCVKKNFVERFWDYWFFPWMDLLLHTAAAENRKGEPISGRLIDGRKWIAAGQHPAMNVEDADDYGGVFTDNDDEPNLTYREVCGREWNRIFQVKNGKEKDVVEGKRS